ncbi:MAG: ABC transporter ATP-binding protein [Geminicoccaceae bacterium]
MRQATGLLVLALASAVLALVPPYLTKLVIDEGLIAGDATALVIWSLTLFLFGAVALGLSVANTLLHMRASITMLAELRRTVIEQVLGSSAGWRAGQQAGEIVSRIDGDAGEVQRFALDALLSGSGAILRLAGGAAMLFVLSPMLAMLALVLAPLELLFLHWARPRTEQLASDNRAARGVFASALVEMLQGLVAIQIAHGERRVADNLAARQDELNDSLVAMRRFGEVTRAIPTLMTAVMRSLVFIAGGLMVIHEGWPLGSLIAFLSYMVFLVGPMQTMLGLWHSQARVKVALARLDAIMLATDPLPWPAEPAILPDLGGTLVLEDVAVERAGRTLLRNIECVIEAGSTMALSAPSGTGKTSLLMLFQRHEDPAAGRILLDGVDLRDLSKETLRCAVTLVPQRPFLLHGSVADNLRMGAPDAGEREMRDCVELVELWDRFGARGGLEARLGEDGITLSGGERQRLCLARALLSPGRVVCLDEALSEVDGERVRRIMTRLVDRLAGRTLIVVSHASVGHDEKGHVIDLERWRAER